MSSALGLTHLREGEHSWRALPSPPSGEPEPPGRPAPKSVRRTSGRTKREVLALLVEDATYAEIASRLGVAHSTVRNHVANICMRLDVTNRRQAAEVAIAEGLAPATSYEQTPEPMDAAARIEALELRLDRVTDRLQVAISALELEMQSQPSRTVAP